jgi:hypothetical protein
MDGDEMARVLFLCFLSILQTAFATDNSPSVDGQVDDALIQGNPAPLALDPAFVCHVLADEGLGARGGYQAVPADGYRCTSPRKNLNAGGGKVHELRFYATGNDERVSLMGLELAVYSQQEMQRAHRLMKEAADHLVERTLKMPLPAQVAEAIMGAVGGRWTVDARQFSLRRTSLPYWGHELMLTIR